MAVPKIRFPGFTEDWEQRKLGQIIEVKPFKPYIAEANNTGKYPVIQQGDKPLLGYSDKNEPFRDYKSITLFGDHTLSLFKPLEPFFVATDGIKILSSAMYGLFFYYLLDRYKPHSEGYKRHFSILKEQDCWITSQNEQEKIGNFFFGIDQAITLHQRKLESMKLLKKSLLQKMFPKSGETVPEVRFPGFTDAWEQRKLGDLADIVGGGTPSTSKSEYWNGDIDWYAPAEIADQIYVSSSQKKITQAGYDNSSAKMLPVGTVLFTSRAGIGKTAILAQKGCTNQGFQSIVPHEGQLDSYFIFSRTDELKKYGETTGAGSTFVEVSGKQMARMELLMPPTLSEQQEIGRFFASLDSTITLHQRKVEILHKLKKSLLQQMFV